MKKIFILFIIVFITSTACNDEFLERLPLDTISDATYWKSAEDVKMYANPFYAQLYNPLKTWGYGNANMGDQVGDNQVPKNPDYLTWGEYSVPAEGGGWAKSDWLQIRRCNYALDQIARMTKDPQVLKYEGEIRFFKAFFYYIKLKRYGDVPWLTKSLNIDSEELYAPRDSRKTVVDNMVSDLDKAIASLPETDPDDRLTRYAALALKAEICLFEGTFRKYHNLGDHEAVLRLCTGACEAIINSGKFDVYSKGDPFHDYFNLFVQYELKGNIEGIMIQRYIKDKLTHDNPLSLVEQQTGYSKNFAETYLCTDGLPIGLSPLYKGDAAFMDEFENRDPRMKQSMYTPDRPFIIYADGSLVYKTMPEFSNTYNNTGYYITKGLSPYYDDWQASMSIIDGFIYRYGKILVVYAEAKAELGECTQEILDKTVNKLRDRVGMPHLTVEVGFTDPNWPNWEVPVSPLINEIRRERRIEFCAEGDRFDDLRRWKAGKLLENPRTILGARDPQTGDYRIIYPGFPQRKWVDKYYLYPLPTQELALNNKLVQNPGW